MADGGSPDRILAIAVGVVSLAALIAVAALAVSGLALYQSLGGAVSGLAALGGNQTSTPAFNITNGGLLTTTLGVTANVSVEGVEYPIISRQLTLRPGQTGVFNFSVPQAVQQALGEPGVLQAALFRGITVNLTLGFSLALSPFLTATAQGSQVSDIAPVVSNLVVKIGAPAPYNATHVSVPLSISFYDSSDLSLNGTVAATVSDSPTGGKLVGAGSAPFEADANSLNSESLTLYANSSLLKSGVLYANLTVSSAGATASAVVPFTYGGGA